MGKYKRLKKKFRNLEKRVELLESKSKVTLWSYPEEITFPQFARKIEGEISRLRSRINKDG